MVNMGEIIPDSGYFLLRSEIMLGSGVMGGSSDNGFVANCKYLLAIGFKSPILKNILMFLGPTRTVGGSAVCGT